MMKLFAPLRRMSTINRLCCCVENEDNLPVQERDSYVGIQESVGNHLKLNGLMKSRCSHFHVNEIGLDGEIVQLTDLNPPPKPADMAPGEPFYTHCTLYKEGFADPQVLNYLGRKLRIQACDIGTAGIKDKWGKTTQKMSIRNVDPAVLVALFAKHQQIKLGNFTYKKQPLATGDLIGNHFRILLLDVNNEPGSSSSVTDDIDRAVTSLKNFGFINYFGTQRFSFGHRSQIIGKTMLQMNWEQVFDLILSSSKKCPPDYITAAKELWFSVRDPHEIVKHLPPNVGRHAKSKEIWLLQGLAKHYNGGKGNLYEAYKTIPRYMRSLDYAAFKSFLWNHLVSFRIRTFGLRPIPGDIVNLNTVTNVGGTAMSTNIERPVSENVGSNSDHKVRALTSSDFDSNGNCHDYSIYDVVLDLPGSRLTKYANPEVQSYLEMLLKINELEVDCFAKFIEKYGEVTESLNVNSFRFRHLVQKPMNLQYQIVRYSQERDLNGFIPSDLGVLQANEQYSRREKNPTTKTHRDHNDKEKICVSLEFSLLKGTYATIALRELLRCTRTWK